jgi:hypothetical protein
MTTTMEPRLTAYIDQIRDATPNEDEMRSIAEAYGAKHPREAGWAMSVVDIAVVENEAEREDA